MIRGILIASLIFCHGALAQQAPTPGVPSTCNISPYPGENSQNKNLIASQLRERGLKNPTDDHVRCIMNRPREGRLAKIEEMIAAQYPATIPFKNDQTIPLVNVARDAKRMATTLGTNLLHIDVSNNNPTGSPSSLNQMNMPILVCKSSEPCKLEYISAKRYIPFYKITGMYDIVDAPPIEFGQGGVPLTKMLIGNKNVIAHYPNTNNTIAIQFDPTQIENVSKMNQPTLKCKPKNICNLITAGELQAQPQSIVYKIKGDYTIVDEAPTEQAEKNAQYLEKMDFPREAIINIIKERPSDTQVYAKPQVKPQNSPDQMMIELDEGLVKNMPTNKSLRLKCTTDSCTLMLSKVLKGQPEILVYKVSAGTFEIAN